MAWICIYANHYLGLAIISLIFSFHISLVCAALSLSVMQLI